MNYKNYLKKIDEEFEGSFKRSAYTDKKVDVYLNANKDEISEIIHDDPYGVRIGIVTPYEIYYWIASITHKEMATIIKKSFKLQLTYDHYQHQIFDYEAEDAGYATPDKYKLIAPIDILDRIVDKLNYLFNNPVYSSYMNIATVKLDRKPSLASMYHENYIRKYIKD